jgi:hypothetical protein
LVSTSTIAPTAASVTDFQIGRLVGSSQYFKGYVDDLRIYSRALSLDELKLAMNTPITGISQAPAMALAPSAETLPGADEIQSPVEQATLSTAKPVVDIQLERKTYRQGDAVGSRAFWISNPSDQSRNVELKTWITLPGMQPIPLDDLGVDEIPSLQPGFNQNYGVVPFMRISRDAPAGTCEVGARLIDPVTGDILSQDINPFTIAAGKNIHSNTAAAFDTAAEYPHVMLESYVEDSRPQYLIKNQGTGPADVEVKMWLETPEGEPVPLFSIGAEGSFTVPDGASITLDPLATMILSPGTYVIRARVLDSASGEILCENKSELVIAR